MNLTDIIEALVEAKQDLENVGEERNKLFLKCHQLVGEVRDLREKEALKPQWISVKDKSPPKGVSHRFLFVNGKGEVTLGYACEDNGEGEWDTGSPHLIWINDVDRGTYEVATHWMELPQPPEEKKG